MFRIKKLENHYQKQLTEHKVKDISDFIHSIVNADITKGKYARFLIESFLNNKFLEEDLIGGLDSTVGQAISLFDKYKGKLPINERSIYALDKETKLPLYQSPGDLWKVVKQYQDEKSGKELKKEEQEQIYRETEFVYKNKETGFQIVSPLTKESAKWWGRGTRWCTSADKNNMFWNYAKDSPLFILLLPNGDKLQLWKNKNDIQFMDESDNDVDIEYIEQHWSILEPICLWLNDIKYIPEKYLTPEICELAVKNNGWALRYIPKELITQELCNIAIQKNDDILDLVPEKYKTKDFYTLLIKKNGNQIFNTPKELITPEICELAVKNNGLSLCHVPKELITQELCELAVKQNGLSLCHVPDELKTYKLCELSIQQNDNSVKYIPDKYKTKELCEVAVKKDGCSLKYVPKELRTKELCELAYKQNKSCFRMIPIEYQKDIKNNNKVTIDKEKYNVTYKGILDHITQRTKFSDASLNIV
jgi:hypothetical protein